MKRVTHWAAKGLIAAAVAAPVNILTGCEDRATPPAANAPAAAAATAPAAPQTSQDAAARARATLDKALTYLKSQQKPDGGWQGEKDPPAMTAIVLKALVGSGTYNADDEFVKKGYEKLLSYQVEEGGIYKDLLANYNTAIAVSALAAANKPEFKEPIEKATAYLKGLQWTEKTRPEHPDPAKRPAPVESDKDPRYGGTGYGGLSRGAARPDLSNVQLTLEALKDAGLKPDDPAFQNALKFVSRMQNSSETNDQEWAGDDGGFIYSPADHGKGESFAGEYTGPDGRRMLRSYGSMTYAGLKSMMYAGLTKEDPRVKAAWDWIGKNWTLDENPGMRLNKPELARQGLYYYYHTLARALNAYDEPIISDPQGNKHDWRVEFVDKMASLQQPDGSWTGDKKWMEENPLLVTSYVAIALEETLEDLKQHPPRQN